MTNLNTSTIGRQTVKYGVNRLALGILGVCLGVMLAANAFAGVRELKPVTDAEIKKLNDAMPVKATVKPRKARELLVFCLCDGFFHQSIPVGNKCFELMGKKTGAFKATVSQDMAMFDAKNLKKFDAVMFNNTTRLKFGDPKRREALMDFVKKGKGIIGIHAASDNFYDFPEAAEMMGGLFAGHPWGAGGTWAVKLDDPKHPVNKGFMGKGFMIKDEIYQIKGPYSRDTHRVLLSLDMSNAVNQRGGRPDKDNAISWLRTVGKGRVFYCSLGHNNEIFWNKAVVQHCLDGIQYALGDLKVDATPSAKLKKQPVPALTTGTAAAMNALDGLASADFGDDSWVFDSIEELAGTTNPATCAKLEKRLIAALKNPKATYAAKQFSCRMLRRVGTKESLPVLGGLLTDKKLSHMARYAMEGMSYKEIDGILLRALRKTEGKARVGVINSIGARGIKNAVSPLSKLAKSKDAAIARAAVVALGDIGGSKAAKALSKTRVDASLELPRMDAYLRCLDSMVAAGKGKAAVKLYRNVFEKSDSALIRVAALSGIAMADGTKAVPLLLDTLESDDAALVLGARTALVATPGNAITEALVDRLPSMSASMQVIVLGALSCRQASAGSAGAVDKLAASGTGEVRIAALRALGSIGGLSSIDTLVKNLAAGGDIAAAASDSLRKLRVEGTDTVLIEMIDHADNQMRTLLVKSLVVRRCATAGPLLLKLATDENKAVRREALRAVGILGTDMELQALVDLLARSNNGDLEQVADAINSVCARSNDKQKWAGRLVAILPRLDVAAKCSVLKLVGSIGGNTALGSVREALTHDNEDVRNAAIRALVEWPDVGAIADVEDLAENAQNEIHRILGLRGYVRMIGLPSKRSADATVKLYEKAMGLAGRPDDKKLVLSNLRTVPHVNALEMAVAGLDDQGCAAEAALAAIQIARQIKDSNPAQTKAAMRKVIDVVKQDNLVDAAKGVIDEIEKYKSMITTWLVSGPYTAKGKNGPALFDVAFPPENPGAKDVKWKRVGQVSRGAVNLTGLLGGNHRVAYLKTGVVSDTQQQAILALGSDDGIKVWLNGELIHANNASRRLREGEDKVEITLKKGHNALLMKIVQGGNSWGACARVGDPKGGNLEGLTFEVN